MRHFGTSKVFFYVIDRSPKVFFYVIDGRPKVFFYVIGGNPKVFFYVIDRGGVAQSENPGLYSQGSHYPIS